ncbi:hypothetical protein E4631_24645 [Hymenobacter sp. UV11]|uniref:hypothetical protein n=1 Tax=Hymenobacter sp. UV11 TaxID=1849735 RepID=UPI00105F98B0|nr:hypothetical protein [Hymenobacter sp. UV11]TDN35872.1 hypothetical protein A8B98_11875 [Hymenobacter sp. UV11]TFZ62744.1 hypothetical protein E4631_24645 [Hymenobacter sp. UV11]
MKKLLLAGVLWAGLATLAVGQVIQFTGLVVSGDSLVGVPAVEVRVPHTRRHTVTAYNGYFSLPVLAGDSIEVRASNSITRLRIPLDYPRASYSLLVKLQADAQFMPLLGAGFAQRFRELKLPPPPTVEMPAVSTKALRPLIYDTKGRKTN